MCGSPRSLQASSEAKAGEFQARRHSVPSLLPVDSPFHCLHRLLIEKVTHVHGRRL